MKAKSSLEIFPYGLIARSNSQPAIANRNAEGSAPGFCLAAVRAAGSEAANAPKKVLRLVCIIEVAPHLLRSGDSYSLRHFCRRIREGRQYTGLRSFFLPVSHASCCVCERLGHLRPGPSMSRIGEVSLH